MRLRMASSGLLTSWAMLAAIRPIAAMRSDSKRAASVSLRSVMSRAILEMPTMRPVVSRMGEMVSEMLRSSPFLRRRRVSKCSMRSPEVTLRRISGSSE